MQNCNTHKMASKFMNTTLEEGELEQSVCSLVEKSWYEECEEADKMTVCTVNHIYCAHTHNTHFCCWFFLPIFYAREKNQMNYFSLVFFFRLKN